MPVHSVNERYGFLGQGPRVLWAALDDWQEGFVRDEPRLVAVPGEFGLQRVHLEQVARILNLVR